MLTALALVFEERTKMVYYYLYLAHKRITQLEDVGCLLAALMGNGICESAHANLAFEKYQQQLECNQKFGRFAKEAKVQAVKNQGEI